MACLKCGAADDPNTAAWNVGTLCTPHYTAAAGRYNGTITNAALLDDVLKVHTLLHENPTLCLAHLAMLANEQSTASMVPTPNQPVTGDPRFAKVGAHGANYLRLSRALEYYEGLCWFPANRILLGGLLSGKDFFKSVKLGHNKDPGAGVAHGDQSHRLQWHVIMRVMTNDFTAVPALGWTHSPLSLFFELTQRHGAVWGPLLDAQANPNWANPDNVKVAVLSSGHAMLAEAVQRRSNKMGGGTIANPASTAKSPRDTQIETSYLHLVGTGAVAHAGGLFEKIVLQIYTWEKYKTAPPTAHNTPEKAAALAVYNHAVAAQPALFGLKGTYNKLGTNLLAKQGAPDLGVKINQVRVNSSMGGFNPQYAHSAMQGAYPAAPGRY